MKEISLLISPEVKAAYFNDYVACATEELRFCFPELTPVHAPIGMLQFINITVDEKHLEKISKLSFFQGAFERIDNKLVPLELAPDFKLHDNFIFGSKFKGKTNERFTQLMFNIGLASIDKIQKVKILDPMCGRGTTLLWAMRYGLNAKGIEIDPKAVNDVTQIVKKWSKITGISGKVKDGFIAKKTKSGVGKFIEFTSEGQNFKFITGDSSDAPNLLREERFDLIITDMPYGVQHRAYNGEKNPLAAIEQCLPQWTKCLGDDGVIVIGYNSNNPKREKLLELAESLNLKPIDVTIPHRMSESIVRDIIVLKK
ncbi:MAG: hypothetical protein KAG61_08930 [Bacteriovoracaceae bacterium]|nr:hypothetical protein [Bacteriovoracaceae bacterium]